MEKSSKKVDDKIQGKVDDRVEKATPEKKKTKTGIFSRLSTGKNKLRKSRIAEARNIEERGKVRTGQNAAELNDKKSVEIMAENPAENLDFNKTIVKYVGKGDGCSVEEEKAGNQEAENIESAGDGFKPEANTNISHDSTNVQNHEACEQPEGFDKSEAGTNQPITVDLQDVDEGNVFQSESDLVESKAEAFNTMIQPINHDKEQVPDTDTSQEMNEKDDTTPQESQVENLGQRDASYTMQAIRLPSDIAHKAVQRFRQVLRPIFIYLIKKHPNCFQDIIESNKKPH